MKSVLDKIFSSLRSREESREIVGIIFFVYLMLFGFWNSFSQFDSFFEQLMHISTFILSVILSILFAVANLYFIGYLSNKNLNDFSWYLKTIKVLVSNTLWGNNQWFKMFILIQILNFIFMIVFLDYYFYALFLLPIIVMFCSFSTHLKRGKEALVLFSGNLLFSIVVFTIFNFKIIGVYFYSLFTRSICLINYGFGEKGDPLKSVEFLDSIELWEKLGNPVPGLENGLQFSTYGFWDTLIFYLYPIFLLLILLNTHYFVGKVVSLTFSEKEIIKGKS